LVAVAVTAGGLAGASSASAQQNPSPPGCSASRLHLDIDGTPSLVRMGDVIRYTLSLDNIGQNACDVNNVNVTLQVPSRSGTPVATGESKATFQSLPAQWPQNLGLSSFTLGPYFYTVDVDPGVTVLQARTAVDNAQLQDIARTPVNINKGTSSILFTPSITIDKVGSMTGPAPAPQTVIYTFYVRNGANPALNPADTALSNVSVTDDKCGNPTYASGDTNGNNKLETTETWAFTCTLTHPTAGTYTNVATASGQNILNNRAVPVQSPPDNWTVVLTAPPSTTPPGTTPPTTTTTPPQVAVKPAEATQSPCTLSTASGLTVRAGETTTIRVSTKNVAKNALVKITLPGGKVVSGRTNSKGVATIKVHPTRSGTATIKAPECSDVERLAVRPARKVVSRQLPRVTG